MSEFTISLTNRRRILVQLYYRYALTNSSVKKIKQDILDETQEKLDLKTAEIANDIADKLFNLIDILATLLKEKWEWERIPSYIQASLIVGLYEVKYTDTPKPVTINEILKLIQIAMPGYDYKFVNAVLDKVEKPNG